MDTSAIIVAAIAALAAILSAPLNSLINNHYELKKQQLETTLTIQNDANNYARSVQEKYLVSVSRYINDPTDENRKLYGESYALVFLYVPTNLHHQLESIHANICDKDFDNATFDLEQFSRNLAKELNPTIK